MPLKNNNNCIKIKTAINSLPQLLPYAGIVLGRGLMPKEVEIKKKQLKNSIYFDILLTDISHVVLKF